MSWKIFLALVATAFVSALAAVSALMNYAYGLQQGTDAVIIRISGVAVTESLLFGIGSVAIDGLKLVLPIIAVVLYSMKLRIGAAVAAIIAICLSLWSIQSAASFWASSKASIVDGQSQAATQWKHLEDAASKAVIQRAFIGEHRPLPVIQADIDALTMKNEWRWTDKCTDPERARRYCAQYALLVQQRASATEAARLDGEISGYRKEMDTRRKVSDADPLGASIAPVLGISSASISLVRGGFFSILVELSTLFILPTVWAMAMFHQRKKPNDIQDDPTLDNSSVPVEIADKFLETPRILPQLTIVRDEPQKKAGLSDDVIASIVHMDHEGKTQAAIASALGVSQSSVSRALKRSKESVPALGKMAHRA